MIEDDDVDVIAGGTKPTAATLLKAVRLFLQSIVKSTGCSPEVLLCSTVYLQRVRSSGAYRLTLKTFCVLTTACLYLASKFLHDKVFSVKHWAAISGFAATDISFAERELLHVMDWELFVSCDDLMKLMSRRDTSRPSTRVTMAK